MLQRLLHLGEFASELRDERSGFSHGPRTTKALKVMTQLDERERTYPRTPGGEDMGRVCERCAIMGIECQLQVEESARGILEEGLDMAREACGLWLVSKVVQRFRKCAGF